MDTGSNAVTNGLLLRCLKNQLRLQLRWKREWGSEGQAPALPLAQSGLLLGGKEARLPQEPRGREVGSGRG